MTVFELADTETLRIRGEKGKRIRAVLAHLKAAEPKEQARIFAKNRVKWGFRWLAQHAPYPGWWRNCFNPDGRCRINMRYTEDAVVALAFEYEARFTDSSCYVKDWRVLKHFFGLDWQRRSRLLGFMTDSIQQYKPHPRRFPDAAITDDLLTEYWEVRLRKPPGDWTIQYRHQTPVDRLLLGDDHPFGKPKGRFRQMLWGLSDSLRGKKVA
jgi:hypothetical protein